MELLKLKNRVTSYKKMLSFNSFKGCLGMPEPIARIIYDYRINIILPSWQAEHQKIFSNVLNQILEQTQNIIYRLDVMQQIIEPNTQPIDFHTYEIPQNLRLITNYKPGFRIFHITSDQNSGYWKTLDWFMVPYVENDILVHKWRNKVPST